MKEDKVYLLSIADSIAQIESYTKNDKKVYDESRMVRDAVMRNLEIIGEAAKHLSEEMREKHSTIPWRQVAGLRDVLIHDYMGVDIDEIWNIVEKELPTLKKKVSEMLDEIGNDTSE